MEEKILKFAANLEGIRKVPTFILLCPIADEYTVRVVQALGTVDVSHKEIDVILVSPGGSADEAYKMIRTFRQRFESVNVIVPYWAKSAATIFALGASRLVMHEFGELGPIDAQIRKDDPDSPEESWTSALNVQSSLSQIEERSMVGVRTMLKTLRDDESVRIGRSHLMEMLLKYSAEFYKPLLDQINVGEIGEMARYLEIGKMYAKRTLAQYADEISQQKLDDLLELLVYNAPDHGYIVDYAVIHDFLPSVVKSDEAPFSPKYDEVLGHLSMLLMTLIASGQMSSVDSQVGFVNTLIASRGNNDKVTKEERAANEEPAETQVNQDQRPGAKSSGSTNQKRTSRSTSSRK